MRALERLIWWRRLRSRRQERRAIRERNAMVLDVMIPALLSDYEAGAASVSFLANWELSRYVYGGGERVRWSAGIGAYLTVNGESFALDWRSKRRIRRAIREARVIERRKALRAATQAAYRRITQ